MDKELLIQIGIEVLSAFLGFLFALLLADMLERRDKKKKYRTAVKCMENELQDIVKALKEYVKLGRELPARIAIPTWDALQYAGMTLEFIDKDYFESLVRVYALIKQYNEDRRENREADNLTLMKEIIECGEETLKKIAPKGV